MTSLYGVRATKDSLAPRRFMALAGREMPWRSARSGPLDFNKMSVSELHSRSPISRLGRAVLRNYIASYSLVGMMTAALSRSRICPRECAVERRMATPCRPPSNHDGRTSQSSRTLTCFPLIAGCTVMSCGSSQATHSRALSGSPSSSTGPTDSTGSTESSQSDIAITSDPQGAAVEMAFGPSTAS